MNGSQRNVGRLVLFQQKLFIALGYQGRSFDDNPVFGAMHMFLQGNFSPRLYGDALDQKALGNIHILITAPGTVDHFV